MASNEDIIRMLVRIEAKQEEAGKVMDRLLDDFADEKKSAHESRAGLHRRLDEHADRISSLRTDIEIHGQIGAQLRDNIKGLKETVETDISPTIDEWKRIKFLGGAASAALIALGVTAATAVAWIYDWLAIVLRYLSKGH